ncbi:helix-turn-helix domain-containing protein [Streptomyces sp. NBC_01465]|uniref:helix-turn-helix domain-containing protein n=1 Tax=Streptomyces sp. NBC_01465 TaxID=2903878 RepID=UPI002E327247|nr:helix-turn-helix transcriptional regulator [Streptomyces sp. NBC_01465]
MSSIGPNQDLAAALRALRKAAGHKAETTARRAVMSPSKLSKIETGKALPTVGDVERILTALDVPDDAKGELLRAARAAATEATAWRAVRRTGYWKHQQEIQAIESQTRTLRLFQGQLVPGLLQSAEYMSAIFDLPPGLGPETKAKAVAARLERQQALYDTTRTFHFLMTESVLRWLICPPAVMAVQLDRLLSLARLPNVQLGLLPLGRRMPDFPMTCFSAYDERLVIVETFHAQVNTRDPKDVALYLETFERFAQVALYDAEMSTLIVDVRDDFLRQQERT